MKPIPLTLALIAFALMTWGYIWQVRNQADLSAMATPATVEALAMLRETDPAAGIITNSFTLALWISALNKVPSPHTWTTEPPSRFTETDQKVRCVLGWRKIPERIIIYEHGTVTKGCNPIEAAEELGAGYVLIEGRFPFYNERAPAVWGSLNPKEPWADLPNLPWLEEVFQEGTTTVYRILANQTRTSRAQY